MGVPTHRGRFGEVLPGSVAISFCRCRLDAELRAITVSPRYGPLDLLFEPAAVARERFQERIENGLAMVPPGVLIVGSRSYGPLRSVLLGSVSADLVRTAACATLVIPLGFPVSAAAEDSGLLPPAVPDPSGATT